MGKEEDGATSIIGTVLIITIALGIITTILTWSLPIIDESKSYIESSGVIDQFKILDKDVQDIVRQGTSASKDVSVSINSGQISVANNADRFITAYSTNDNYAFDMSGLDDDDNSFTLTMNSGIADRATIYWDLNNMTDFENISISSEPATPTTINASQPLIGAICIELYDTNVTFGKIVLFDVGAMKYLNLKSAGGSASTIWYESGAVISKSLSGTGYMHVKPTTAQHDDDLYLRFINIAYSSTDGSVGGSGMGTYRFSIERTSNAVFYATEVHMLKMQIYGENSETWLKYFQDCDFTLTGDTLTYTHSNIDIVMSLFVMNAALSDMI